MLKRASSLTLVVLLLVPGLSASDISAILNRLARGIADDETLSELQVKIRLDPSATSWWAWLGYAHCLRQEWERAEEAYRQAERMGSKPSFPWFPPILPVSWLPKHGSLRPLTIGGLTIWQSPTVFSEPLSPSDPKHGDRFSRIVFVYGEEKGAQQANQLVHWLIQNGELSPHLSDAPSVFAAALNLFSKRFKMPLKFPIKAWLFARGDGSAFSFSGHTLFYGSIPNDSWPWWLKVAHEAGHHAVPAFGEFDELHEPYSGGFLGERLFALWLWDEGKGIWSEDPKLQHQLENYLLETVSAEIVRAQQWLLQDSKPQKPPMRVFLGLCLYLERLGGWELLSDVMGKATEDSWEGFSVGLEKTFLEKLKDGLSLRLRTPDANTPLSSFDISALSEGLIAQKIQLAWWLPEGRFQGSVKVRGEGALQVRWGENQIAEWNIGTERPQTFLFTFGNQKTGWQRLRFWWLKGSGKILSVTFKRIVHDGHGE